MRTNPLVSEAFARFPVSVMSDHALENTSGTPAGYFKVLKLRMNVSYYRYPTGKSLDLSNGLN